MPTIYENTTYKPNEVGIIADLDMQIYRDAPGLAESDLQQLIENPAAFARKERKEATPDMEFGTLFHSMLLSGKLDCHVIPQTYKGPESAKKDAPLIDKPWNWNANVCKEWREQHADKPCIPRFGDNSAVLLEAMVNKVKGHPLGAGFLSRLTPEVSLFARNDDHPVLCKGRLDGLIREGGGAIVIEVKTTRDASTLAFSREIMKRGYYRKAAWYRMLLHQLRISPVEFWYIAIEKSEKPRVNVRKLAERAMDRGDFDNDDALALYMKCKMANHWPEFSDAAFPGEEQNELIDLPDYFYGKDADVITGLTEPAEKETS